MIVSMMAAPALPTRTAKPKWTSGVHLLPSFSQQLAATAPTLQFPKYNVTRTNPVLKSSRTDRATLAVRSQASPGYVPEADFYKIEAILRYEWLSHFTVHLALKLLISMSQYLTCSFLWMAPAAGGGDFGDVKAVESFSCVIGEYSYDEGSEFSEDNFIAKVKVEIVVSKDQKLDMGSYELSNPNLSISHYCCRHRRPTASLVTLCVASGVCRCPLLLWCRLISCLTLLLLPNGVASHVLPDIATSAAAVLLSLDCLGEACRSSLPLIVVLLSLPSSVIGLVTTILLTNENYLPWSATMTMGIAGRGRIAYIDGRNLEPAKTSGNLSVVDYYGALKAKWEDLDYYSDITWHCLQDQTLHVAKEWENRVFLFLAGLNDEFEGVRSQILNSGEVSNIEDVYSRVEAEEQRRLVTTEGKRDLMSYNERFALVSRGPGEKKGNKRRSSNGKPNVFEETKSSGGKVSISAEQLRELRTYLGQIDVNQRMCLRRRKGMTPELRRKVIVCLDRSTLDEVLEQRSGPDKPALQRSRAGPERPARLQSPALRFPAPPPPMPVSVSAPLPVTLSISLLPSRLPLHFPSPSPSPFPSPPPGQSLFLLLFFFSHHLLFFLAET
ncbi:Nitrogen regulatory P-II-like protein [Nymphaea thermarum]|nr:Nitrogen regulatory P-II-like protein [Nymphaea thermarum]